MRLLKKYPYWIVLLACLICWAGAFFSFRATKESASPEGMARAVSNDLRYRLRAYESFKADKVFLNKIVHHTLDKRDLKKVMDLPFLFDLYEGNKLIFWNSNLALAGEDSPGPNKVYDSSHVERDIFYTSNDTLQIRGKKYHIAVLTPVAWLYPFQNDYLTPYWEATQQIPSSTEVLYTAEKNTLPVYGLGKSPAFYIRFIPEDLNPAIPTPLTICLTLAAVLFLLLWLQLLSLYISKIYSPKAGGWFTLGCIVLLRLFIYIFGLPFNIDELELFSPDLYASSNLAPSLGQLLIDTLFIAWISLFVIVHKPLWIKDGIDKQSRWVRVTVFLIAATWLRVVTFGFVTVMQSLVIDSKISFDLNHYNRIDWHSIIAFIIIALITSTTAMIFYYLNVQFNKMIPVKWQKYLIAFLANGTVTAIMVMHFKESMFFRQMVTAWVVLFLILLDSKRLKISREFLSPSMILWAVFLCFSTTIILQYFVYIKEQTARKALAEKLANQSDPMISYLLGDLVPEIRHDETFHSFFSHPTEEDRALLNSRLDVLYLERLKKYQWNIYLFDSNDKPLFNGDSTSVRDLTLRIHNSTTEDNLLFFNERAQNGHNFTIKLPVYNDSNRITGKMFISLALKKSDYETVYPELLQPSNVRPQKMDQNQSYAIYDDGKLVSQSSNYPFSLTIAQATKNEPQYKFVSHDGYSTLYYRPNDKKTIVVAYKPERDWSITRMFSFVFGAQITISLLYGFHHLILLSIFIQHRQKVKKTIRPLSKRLRLTILLIFLGSFIFIGVATSIILTVQYDRSTTVRLLTSMEQMETSIHQYLSSHHGLDDEAHFNAITHEQRFEYYIINLGTQRPADINIFDSKGFLNATSQSHIYDKNILARIMRPDAYYKLFYKQQSSLIQTEQIGKLDYQSCYMPIRNLTTGVTLGYLNVPYFTSEKDIREQISTIVSALINVYVLVFLLSGLIAYLFTQSLTKPLQMIISGFNQVNLDQNKPLEWPNEEDEIGKLVHSYNRMVKKVEDLAIQLAHNEREGAWREMARQVAHEIKNPLTPMKLSIQYLQRAVAQNRPDVPALAERVSGTLIEQIDNLSYIASEFSNFAKLPEAKPEQIELNTFLEKQVQLYNSRETLDISFHSNGEPLFIFIDQSQLLRSFMNLLQNAVQSIPEDAPGKIIIRLLHEEGHALISITDNGTGIPEEKKERIFKPYFTTKSSGTGLGLAMTKKIIEVANGSIWFESEEGKGTTFYVQFPLVKRQK